MRTVTRHHVECVSLDNNPHQRHWTVMDTFDSAIEAEMFRDDVIAANPHAADLLRITSSNEERPSGPEDFIQYFSLSLKSVVKHPHPRKIVTYGYSMISHIHEKNHKAYADTAAQLEANPDSLIARIRSLQDGSPSVFLVDPEPEELAVAFTKYYEENPLYVGVSSGDSTLAVLFTRHPEILDTLLDEDDDFLPRVSDAVEYIRTLPQERDPSTGRMRTIFP